MDFIELARSRYSCKKFDPRQISKEQLDCILEAGRLAPTAKNLQEQHVYAPTMLIVAFDKNNVFTYPGQKYDSGIEDATIVTTHMMLCAKSVGVDSCWVNFFDPDKMAEVFLLPENEEILTCLALGFPAEGAGPLANHNSRKPIEETVTYL